MINIIRIIYYWTLGADLSLYYYIVTSSSIEIPIAKNKSLVFVGVLNYETICYKDHVDKLGPLSIN